MSSTSELKSEISKFLSDFSVETTPHDADNLKQYPDALKAGQRVYIAHPPGMSIDDVVDFAGRVRNLGLVPVPHIIARKLESREQLAKALARLQKMDIDHALVIAGDIVVDNHAFDSSLEVLKTGLLQEHGFRRVGIAGHPEGSKAIGDERARQALLDKVAFVADAPFKTYIVTQFGFDADAFTSWDMETAKAGIKLPIHVGMAGPASIRQLVRFAMMCGVGASARMLMTRTGATANLLRTQSPDDLITEFARHRLANPSARLERGHFFCFGGVIKTAQWANKVVAGKFTFNKDGTGFKVES
jgi:methylenetetrahydrofolate reductase (NADH)